MTRKPFMRCHAEHFDGHAGVSLGTGREIRVPSPQSVTVEEAIGHLQEMIAIGGKLTEELAVKLSPLIVPRPEADEELKRLDVPQCPLVDSLGKLQHMAQNNIGRLQYLLREICL